MNVIVSKKELKSIQEGVDIIIDKINEIDATDGTTKVEVLERLETLKDAVHVKYKIFDGEFVIAIPEELISDFLSTYMKAICRFLPVFKALSPIVEMMKLMVAETKDDMKAFDTKYGFLPSDETRPKKEEENTNGVVTQTFHPNGDSTCQCYGGTLFCENCRPF